MECNPSETVQHLVDNHQAFEKALARLYQVAFHIVHIHEDAEDVVQQSLLNAIDSEKTFAKQCDLTTWLCQIVRNQARNLLHRRQHFPHLSLDEEMAVPSPLTVECDLNNRIDHTRILAAVPNLLRRVEADVVHLHYVLGWSCKEIAHGTGRTARAIRQLLYRTLSKLRTHFASNLDYERETTKAGRHSGRLL